MKKVGFFFALVALMAMISCKKESNITPETISNVVETDNPPREIWSEYSDSGYTWKAYITATDLATQTVTEYNCMYDEDDHITYNCGMWNTMTAHKYFGLYKGKIYISKSIITLTANHYTMREVTDAVTRKDAIIANYCTGCDNYPNEYMGALYMTGLDGPNRQANPSPK